MDSVFGYQLFFFSLIIISSIFGRKARNIVCIGSVIFTLIMIFVNWLLILQLGTIALAFLFSEYLIDKLKGKGCLIGLIGFVICILYFALEGNKNRGDDSKLIQENLQPSDDAGFDTISDYEPMEFYSDSVSDQESILYDSVSLIAEDDFIERSAIRSTILRYYINAENERDMDLMNVYLNQSLDVFWNNKNVHKDEIMETYKSNWNKYPNSFTQIRSISNHPSNPSLFKVEVEYHYGNNQNYNTIRFIFDENNTIIGIY